MNLELMFLDYTKEKANRWTFDWAPWYNNRLITLQMSIIIVIGQNIKDHITTSTSSIDVPCLMSPHSWM